MKLLSLKKSGFLKSYYEQKSYRNLQKKFAFFLFILGMMRFFYMVKTKQINPFPFISDLMRTEEGRMMVSQFLFSSGNNFQM